MSFSMHIVLSKFILDITDIGEGKHHKETWTYNQYNRPEQLWRSMLMPFLYEKRPFPSSGTVIGWYYILSNRYY